MLTNNTKRIYNISAKLSPADIAEIKVYIQESVGIFCSSNPGENFSVRLLFGGVNRDWNGTALQKIYDWYKNQGKNHDTAAKRAAIDVGRLLKSVLNDDKTKTFEIVGKDSGILYKLAE